MIIAFQIILLIVIIIGFLGSFGEKEDKELRNNMTTICIASIAAYLVTVMFL